MGTAFSKGKKNKQSQDDIHESQKQNISIKNQNNIHNLKYGKNGSSVLTATGSSSSSVTHQQQHPYLNSLNPQNIEINTGLTSSLIPSNSKSMSYNLNKGGITTATPQSTQPLRNNTRDKHLNSIYLHKLLAFGWIRHEFLMNTQHTDIASNILEICFDFIYIEQILFCFIAAENEKISTIQAIDLNNIYKSQYQLSPKINIGYDTNGICIYSESDISFPANIGKKYNLDTIKNRYHIIFKCGSQQNRNSKAIIIPQQQFNYTNNYNASKANIDDNIFEAYEWILPPLSNDLSSYGNTVSFSAQHGLISIGGLQPDIFMGAGSYSGVLQLKWKDLEEDNNININDNDNNNKKWRWKSLRRMNTGRAHASSTFFIDSSGIQHLFICGGDLNGSVEVYNFQQNQWNDVANTNVSRECAGIYYDKYENLIYLGGGHGAQKKIECYDIYKNEWNIFPNTMCNHDFYPSLFKSSYHYDILYIISPKSNLCEYIDKREGKWSNAKWNIIYDHELHDKLFKIPIEVDFDQFKFIK